MAGFLSNILGGSRETTSSPTSVPSGSGISTYNKSAVQELVETWGIPSAQSVWGKSYKAALFAHETGHVGRVIEEGLFPSAIAVAQGGGAGGVVNAVKAKTDELRMQRLVAGEAAAFAIGQKEYQLNTMGMQDAIDWIKTAHPEVQHVSQISEQHLTEWSNAVNEEIGRLQSNPTQLGALSQLGYELTKNPVWISSGSQRSKEFFKEQFGYSPSPNLSQYGAENIPMMKDYRASMMEYANVVGSTNVASFMNKYTVGVEESLWATQGAIDQPYMGMQSVGGFNFPIGDYPSQGFNGVMGYDQIFAGARNRPDYITMQQGNAIYDAQQHLYGGMSAERRAQMPRQGEDPKLNEAAQELNKTFKELAETMGISAKQGVTYRQVLQTVFDAAGLNPNNPQSAANISAYKAIQGMGAAGIDVGQALANWDLPRGGGIGGSGVQPPGATGVPGAGNAGGGGGAANVGGSFFNFGEAGGGFAQAFNRAARSYYAIRGPYREFVEPVMQDIANYGQMAQAQYQQLMGYGAQGGITGPYAQYSSMVANQQFAQLGIGRAATLAYSSFLGANAGQNENLNYLQGVLSPAIGVGMAAGLATGNPLVGAGVGIGAAAIGTIGYANAANADPYVAGKMYAAMQAGGGQTLGGVGAFIGNNIPAAIGLAGQGIGAAAQDLFASMGRGGLVTTASDALQQQIALGRQYGNIQTGFMNQSMAQIMANPAAVTNGMLNAQTITTGATMLAQNNAIGWSGLDANSRLQIATQVVSAYGMQGMAGQGLMAQQNQIAGNLASIQAAGGQFNANLYTSGLGGNQLSPVGTAAYGQALATGTGWAAANPAANKILGAYSNQIMAGQNAWITVGGEGTPIEVYQTLSQRAANGDVEAQRQLERMISGDPIKAAAQRAQQLSGFGVSDPNAYAKNIIGRGMGSQAAQGQALSSILRYGAPSVTSGAVEAGGALLEGGFDINAIMSNRLLGMGMNAAAPGALGAATGALNQFYYMNNAQRTVQAQAEAQAAQINLGYGAYGNMNVGNFNTLTRGFAQQPAQAAQFGALVSGNAIAWSQAADQGIGPQAWRTVQTGSQGGTAGMGAGYDERISAAQASMVSARGVASGFMRGDGRYSVSQLAGMNERQRTEALYGLQIESRNEGFAYETANLERSRRSQLTERGFEDTGIALSRAQQDWGRYIQGQQIGIQGAQLQANYAYQGTQLAFGRQREITQQGWQQQDLAYQRNVAELQYGYNMIDAQEDIRYSTGRQRRVAMRHQQETTVMFSLQEGQQTREEQRAAQQRQWSQQQFNLEKQHFEQTHQFEVQNFELTKQNYQKEGEFIRQNRALEDQERVFRRSIQDEQFAADKQHLQTTQQIKKTMDDLNGATQTWNTLVTEAKANMQYQASTGTILNQQAVQYYSTQAQTTAQNYLTSQAYHQSITYTQPGIGLPSIPTKHIGGAGADLGGVIGMPSYALGGFTGLGRKNLEVGTVHAGEHVVPQGGSLVYSNPEMMKALLAINATLQQIHKDGGNAIININQSTPANALRQGQSLYQKAYAQ